MTEPWVNAGPPGVGRPVFAECDDELAVEQAGGIGFGRNAELFEAGRGLDQHRVSKNEAAGEDGGVVALGVVSGAAVGADIVGLTAEDLLLRCRGECRASIP